MLLFLGSWLFLIVVAIILYFGWYYVITTVFEWLRPKPYDPVEYDDPDK